MRVGTRWIWTLSLLFMVVGCAGLPAAKHEPSSAAQTIVPGTPDEVGNALVQEMARRQFALTGRSEGYLAFDRPIDNAALWGKLDGAPDRLPRARVVMTLTPVGSSTRVAADLLIIAAPGTGREHLVQASALGVDPRLGDILLDTQATVIAERGSSDPRVAFAVAPIKY